MNRATLDVRAKYLPQVPTSPIEELPHLTAAERRVYDYVNEGGLRLEQERVGVDVVRRALSVM